MDIINQIIHGDITEIAGQLPAQSVNCIVTSPPYWGLRDYGTGTLGGGGSDCDHVEKTLAPSQHSTLEDHGKDGRSPQLDSIKYQYKKICAKCGANRIDQQIGQEDTPEAYVNNLVSIFRDLRRALRDDGTLWLNLGDSYASSGGHTASGKTAKVGNTKNGYALLGSQLPPDGIAPKNLIGIPWRVALALQSDGWFLRSDIIWHKPNSMPESVTDRPTKSHEYIFLLSKRPKYYYDYLAIKEPNDYPDHNRFGNKNAAARGVKELTGNMRHDAPVYTDRTGRNKRDVWTVPTVPYKESHFAVFPPNLIRPCILAGCPPGGVVLDPFFGSGTVAKVAIETGRHYCGVELNADYIALAKKRIAQTQPALFPA